MGDIHGVGGPARRAVMLRAAKTSVFLSALFLVVYGTTNWLTAQRPAAHIGVWYFDWELSAIPFVPLLLVPYMSIDLFFFLAAFLCRDERELRVLARRMTFSILAAAVFFLLLPLQLAWPARPFIGGWFGYFVERSVTAPFLMEYPHNLFPAMHIALCAILTEHYARHARGIVRMFIYFWSALIVLSTVLTWQHHVIDIAGGFVLAAFAFYFFREANARLPVAPNPSVGCCYAACAAFVLALASACWPWGAFALWPAAGLGMVAGAYFGMGPGVFRKSNGRLPLSARFVLAPVLLGQQLSLIFYRRQCRAWDQAAPDILIGRVLNDREAADAIRQGVTAVLDLTGEFSEAAPLLKTNYRNMPILDLTAPTQGQLEEAVAFLQKESATGIVYVHCKIGYSRSAAVAGAYLLANRMAASVPEAIRMLRAVRPRIVVRAEALAALEQFQEKTRELKEVVPAAQPATAPAPS